MNTRKIVLMAMLTTILVVSQVSMSFIPNVEIVTLLLFVYVRQFGLSFTITTSLVFSTILGIIWGFGTWVMMYYLIWPLYILLMHLMSPLLLNKDRCAYFLGFLGLLFGLLFSLEAMFYSSFQLAIVYYIKGLPFDIIHMISNYILCILLLEPINRIFTLQKDKYFAI